eukprot:600379-Amorphochlora_amoeboformis.AAC.1
MVASSLPSPPNICPNPNPDAGLNPTLTLIAYTNPGSKTSLSLNLIQLSYHRMYSFRWLGLPDLRGETLRDKTCRQCRNRI